MVGGSEKGRVEASAYAINIVYRTEKVNRKSQKNAKNLEKRSKYAKRGHKMKAGGFAPEPREIKALKGTAKPSEEALEVAPLTKETLGWWVTEAEHWSGQDHQVLTQKFYDEFAPRLKALKTVGDVDEGLLSRYCETLAHWMKVKTFIAKHGTCHPVYDYYYERDTEGRDVMKKSLKMMKEFPQFQQFIRLETQLRKCEEELGIGAATRTRIAKAPRTATEIEKNAQSQTTSPSHPFDYATRRRAA